MVPSTGLLRSLMPTFFSLAPDLFSETIYFTLVIIVQFTRGTVIGGIKCSWITDTSLEGRDFALDSCALLTQELFLLLGQGLVYGVNYPLSHLAFPPQLPWFNVSLAPDSSLRGIAPETHRLWRLYRPSLHLDFGPSNTHGIHTRWNQVGVLCPRRWLENMGHSRSHGRALAFRSWLWT